eukprot:scaffold25980_cov69-Phaeocystis_antarctica.AAC.2
MSSRCASPPSATRSREAHAPHRLLPGAVRASGVGRSGAQATHLAAAHGWVYGPPFRITHGAACR